MIPIVGVLVFFLGFWSHPNWDLRCTEYLCRDEVSVHVELVGHSGRDTRVISRSRMLHEVCHRIVFRGKNMHYFRMFSRL